MNGSSHKTSLSLHWHYYMYEFSPPFSEALVSEHVFENVLECILEFQCVLKTHWYKNYAIVHTTYSIIVLLLSM